MPSSVVPAPDVSERARQAARVRWGEPRVVRLDSLTTEQRAVILALVDAAKAQKAGGSEGSS